MEAAQRTNVETAGASVLLEHNPCGLDQGLNLIADLELQSFDTPACDDAFNEIVSDAYGDVSHDRVEENIFHAAWELVSRGNCHSNSEL